MIKKYTGAAWVSVPVKVYDGAEWDYADVRKFVSPNWEYINGLKYDEDLSDGLVHYWSFDTNGSDQIGSCDLTVDGATHSASGGKIDGYYSLDGTNDKLRAATGLTSLSDFTINMWLYPDDVSAEIQGYILSLGYNVDNSMLFFYNATDPNVLKISLNEGTNAYTSDDMLTATTWQMVTIQRDSDDLYLYINNVLVHSWSSVDTTAIDTGVFEIGWATERAFDDDRYWAGDVDETGVWTKSLTDAERLKLYNYTKARFYE